MEKMKVWVVSDDEGVLRVCATKKVAKDLLKEIVQVAHIEGCMSDADYKTNMSIIRKWQSRINLITHEEMLDVGKYRIEEMTVKD